MPPLRLLLIPILATLAGCAAAPRTTPTEALLERDATAAALVASGVGIVADGCLMSAGATGSIAYREPSQAYARAAAETLSGYLGKHGIATRGLAVPLLCGGLGTTDSSLQVARDEGGRDHSLSTPVALDERLGGKPGLAAAYSELLRRVSPVPASDPLGLKTDLALELPVEAARRLREDLGSPYVFVAATRGSQIGGGRKVVAALTSGLLTAVLSGGTMVGVGIPQTATAYSLALVDLERQRLLWKTDRIMVKQDPLESARKSAALWLWQGALAEPFLRPPPAVATAAEPAAPLPAAGTSASPRRLGSITLVPVAAPPALYTDNRSPPVIGWLMVGLANKLMDKDKSAQFDARHAAYRLQAGDRFTEALRHELQGQGFAVRVADRNQVVRDEDGQLRTRPFASHEAVLDLRFDDFAMCSRRLDSNYRPVIDASAQLLDPLERGEPLLDNAYRYGAYASAGGEGEITADDRYAFSSFEDLLARPALVEEAFDAGLRGIARQLALDLRRQFPPAPPPPTPVAQVSPATAGSASAAPAKKPRADPNAKAQRRPTTAKQTSG